MATLRKPEHFWPALWMGVLVALAGVVALEHFLGRVTVGEGPRPPAKIVEAKLLPPFALPPDAQSVPETVARPLFVPTRRPSPPSTAATVPTMRKGQFVLTGVTVAQDKVFVFLKELSTGKTKSVRKGMQVNGITVDTVEPRRVVLRQGEETEDLSLSIQVPARVAVAPAATANVPPAPGMVPPAPGMVPPAPGMAAAQPGAVPAAPGTPAAALAAQPGQPPGQATPAPATGRRRPWINAQ